MDAGARDDARGVLDRLRGRDGGDAPSTSASRSWGVRDMTAHDRATLANHAALTSAQLIWGLMHVFANAGLRHIEPTAFCAMRLGVALPFLAAQARREGGRAPWRDLARWVPAMGVSIGGAYLMVFVCNAKSGATLVACVQPLIPVIVAVASACVGQDGLGSKKPLERMTRLKAAGVVVVFVGTVLALKAYEIFTAGGITVGEVFMLLSQVGSYSMYAVLLGLATKTYPYPLLFLFLATAFAEFGIILIAIPAFQNLRASEVPASAWGSVAFAGLASSVVAHSLNSWAIARVKGVLPTVYSGVQVVFTIILARIFLDERLQWDQLIGVCVTMLGVFAVAKAKYAESSDETRDLRDGSASADVSTDAI